MTLLGDWPLGESLHLTLKPREKPSTNRAPPWAVQRVSTRAWYDSYGEDATWNGVVFPTRNSLGLPWPGTQRAILHDECQTPIGVPLARTHVYALDETGIRPRLMACWNVLLACEILTVDYAAQSGVLHSPSSWHVRNFVRGAQTDDNDMVAGAGWPTWRGKNQR